MTENTEYLRQIAVDEYARVTDAVGGAPSTAITTQTLRFGSRRNVYNMELNNENNAAETIYIYTGDAANNRRVLKRRYTLGAYGNLCLFIAITDPVLIFTPTNNRTTPYNENLYGAVGTLPVNVVVTYYDDYVQGNA